MYTSEDEKESITRRKRREKKDALSDLGMTRGQPPHFLSPINLVRAFISYILLSFYCRIPNIAAHGSAAAPGSGLLLPATSPFSCHFLSLKALMSGCQRLTAHSRVAQASDGGLEVGSNIETA